MLSKSIISTVTPLGTVSSITYAQPPLTVTNIFFITKAQITPPHNRGQQRLKLHFSVSERFLFGSRAHLRTAQAGRRMVNFIATMKERHSKKPDELYDMIEHCSPEPFLELFARTPRRGWTQWGDEIPPESKTGNFKGKITPRPMEDGMIRPYRLPQLP